MVLWNSEIALKNRQKSNITNPTFTTTTAMTSSLATFLSPFPSTPYALFHICCAIFAFLSHSFNFTNPKVQPRAIHHQNVKTPLSKNFLQTVTLNFSHHLQEAVTQFVSQYNLNSEKKPHINNCTSVHHNKFMPFHRKAIRHSCCIFLFCKAALYPTKPKQVTI